MCFEENNVKEYVTLTDDGEYLLVNEKQKSYDVEVPEGADCLIKCNNANLFFKGDMIFDDKKQKWFKSGSRNGLGIYLSKEIVLNDYVYHGKIVWERKEPVTSENKFNPLVSQSGGNHYKIHGVQPVEYTMGNNLSFCQGNIIKYITRYADKNGLEDLEKVIHYTLLEAYFKYGEDGSEELKQRVLKLFNK